MAGDQIGMMCVYMCVDCRRDGFVACDRRAAASGRACGLRLRLTCRVASVGVEGGG